MNPEYHWLVVVGIVVRIWALVKVARKIKQSRAYLRGRKNLEAQNTAGGSTEETDLHIQAAIRFRIEQEVWQPGEDLNSWASALRQSLDLGTGRSGIGSISH